MPSVDFQSGCRGRPGLRIDPVKIFEYKKQRLGLALPKQQRLNASKVRWRFCGGSSTATVEHRRKTALKERERQAG